MKLAFGIILSILLIASVASAQQVATPTFWPDGGRFTAWIRVFVGCATSSATIHYTTNGAEPSGGDPIVWPYYGYIDLWRSCTLKAKAFRTGLEPSETKSADFTIVTGTPTFLPDGGLDAEPQKVKITSGGATVYYTTDGSEPTLSSPSIPSGSRVLVDHTLTLKAVALTPGCELSPTKSAEYSFRLPKVWHVRIDGDDANSGDEWGSAKQTFQAAIDAAVAGDEIWVAKGTYFENVRLKGGIKLYGGFLGSEDTIGQRDLEKNNTVLDGANAGPVVAVDYDAMPTTVIDGCTIQHGNGNCGGVYCHFASATVRNCTISENSGSIAAGTCIVSSPEPCLIANNLIVNNIGIGLVFWGYGSHVVNNTIAGNLDAAIKTNMSTTLVNNVIAFNLRGVQAQWYATISGDANCVFANSEYDYWHDRLNGEYPHPTDINVDPLFRDMANGDYRLKWDSPCIDAGTNEGAPATDIEGSVRPMDGNHDGVAVVDIGAYESPIPVRIDVLADVVRLQPHKLVQAVILSDPVFNALTVNPTTVVFGPGNAKEIHGQGHPQDVNADGLTDLLFHFSCAESGIVPGYQTVILAGKLLSGEDIIGSDGVMGIAR